MIYRNRLRAKQKQIETHAPETLVRVCYMDNYNLEDWGPLVHEPGNVCFDLRAAVFEEIKVARRDGPVMVPLGVRFDLPRNMGIKIYPRSSLFKKGLFLANHVAVIDPDYRGEVCAVVWHYEDGLPTYIMPGERIVQAEIVFVNRAVFQTVDENGLSETVRGKKGFGSTGRF